MKSTNLILTFSALMLALAGCTKNGDMLSHQDDSVSANPLPSTLKAGNLSDTAKIKDKYIVVFKADAASMDADAKVRKEHVKGKALGLLKKLELAGEPEEVYGTALQGFSVRIAPGQVAKMLEDSTVSYVEADQFVTMSAGRKTKPAPAPAPAPTTTTTPTTTSTQTIPWGITRVGGGGTYSGTGVAWVIDSGIDLTHPDLNVDATRGISFVYGVSSSNDDNGHGTHVAGIIAAKNNTVGVVGVAPGATLIPVKVLDSTGSGTFSGVLAGIDHVATYGAVGDVANMSLGGGISATIDAAVVNASVKVKFAIAAGNETDNANNHSPARANGTNIYTVSAMASGDSWASFSNYANGPVDYCAPGVSIYSTYKNGGYVSMSGTSMAAPHVAGLLLLGNVTVSGYVRNDPDGIADPIAYK